MVCGAIGAQSKADSLAFLSSQRTTPPTARGLPSGWFPGCTRGLGFPAYVCRRFRCARVMRAGAMHCPLTHSVRMRVCYSTCPPLPLCQRFKIPRPVPSFLPQGQGRGRPSSQQGPPSSCLLDSSPSCGCQAPVPSVSSSVFQFQSLSLFPLASSSTCKHARASSSILKHPPFLSPLPSASQSAPLLTLPCLISQGTLHLPFAS